VGQSIQLPLTQPKLLPRLREAIRVRHMSLKTEKAYVHWVRRFIFFHGRRHPKDLGAGEITAFLNDLAVTRRVAASTQNQTLAALLFLYKVVLEMDLPWLEGIVRAKRSRRLPTVLTQQEVQAVLQNLDGTRWLLVSLLYGAGLRLQECLSLRVKDVDLVGSKLLVRDGKGGKDRVTLLPRSLKAPLAMHLEKVKALHTADLVRGFGEAPLPRALAGKYPKAGYLLGWQYVFPPQTIARMPTRDARCATMFMRKPCSARFSRRYAERGL
jgi:integron integrase